MSAGKMRGMPIGNILNFLSHTTCPGTSEEFCIVIFIVIKDFQAKKKPLVIFTDLDGTLLDSKTYSFEAALPALSLIRREKIPLIICTSKTAAEIKEIRRKLGNSDPFISENGGGIYIPSGFFSFAYACQKEMSGYKIIELGTPYDSLVSALKRIAGSTGLRLKGFSMMDSEEIAKRCSLPLNDAVLARQREYDEPFLVLNNNADKISQLEQAVLKEGLTLTRGGRFFHLTGGNDKGKAVKMLLGLFQRKSGPVQSIALGDSLNDIPMLREADFAVLVQKQDGSYEPEAGLFPCYKSDAPGPEGWNNVVSKLLCSKSE